VTYGSTRIAMYETMKQNTAARDISPSALMLAAMAAVSGFVGAIFGTPADIANIRMQNDRSLPPGLRRSYRHVFDAWAQMKSQEGWRAFGQGLLANCFRGAIMTSSQLASYDYFKKLLKRITGQTNEHAAIQLSASLLASLVATTLCSPMDVIRSHLMGSSGQRSPIAVVRGLIKIDRFRWLFAGWIPSFIRLGPQTIATLVLLEQHKRIYRVLNGYE
jgi:solute carrier family 25 (mitochondrial dicarboxylate transporter), member 10